MLERIQHPPFQVAVARDHERWLGQEFPHSQVACDGRRRFRATAQAASYDWII